jgi:endogenous inhibitor of DNA gyrase (YacG/DUF329 family)
MKCPICEKPVKWEGNPDRPFCSERCRILDLANWSAEEYKVAVPLNDPEETANQPEE